MEKTNNPELEKYLPKRRSTRTKKMVLPPAESLIDNRMNKKIVNRIFSGNREEYGKFLRKPDSSRDLPEAFRVIEEELAYRNIHSQSREAVTFDTIFKRFYLV